MSIAAMNWAWGQKTGSTTDKLVLMALADHADDDGRCFPSQRRIAEKCELARETVLRSISRLSKAGFLRSENQYRDGQGRTANTYHLNISPCDGKSHAPVTEDHTPCDSCVTPPVTPASQQEPPVNHQMNHKEYIGQIDADFAEWYSAYPHKVGKGAAIKAYRTARKLTDHQTLMDGLAAYKLDKPPDRSWCNPATWLNQQRWLDQPKEVFNVQQSHSTGQGQRGSIVAAVSRAVAARNG